jgi:hypothetical protein
VCNGISSKKIITKIGPKVVKLNFKGNPKEGLTIMLTISMTVEKLPLFFVAKGKTISCKKQLGKNPEVKKTRLLLK